MGLSHIKDTQLASMSSLPISEVRRLKVEIAEVLPAGNLPGLILAGLSSIKSRHIGSQKAREHINALFRGADLAPQAVYALLYGGPAVVLGAYQSLLQLTGKDLRDAFPEGTWQFYLQFGLREDTGRHACETTAYHLMRPATATEADDITAWLLAAVDLLFDNFALNGVMWDEWTSLRMVLDAAESAGLARQHPFDTLLRDWQFARPYSAPAGASYAAQRQAAFEQLMRRCYERLPVDALQSIADHMQNSQQERAEFQAQMSLLSYLEPGPHQDERVPMPLADARVGLIYRGSTYLFPLCRVNAQGQPLAETPDGRQWPILFDSQRRLFDPEGRPLILHGAWLYHHSSSGSMEVVARLLPSDPMSLKAQVLALLQADIQPISNVDLALVRAPRAEQQSLRATLPTATRQALELLRRAPILVNWDEHRQEQPLGELRASARRGVGDHALTIIRAGRGLVFDLSHVYFDGLWGMAVAEVMTNQAVAWAQQLEGLQLAPGGEPPALRLTLSPAFEARAAVTRIEQYAEIGAESDFVNLRVLEEARRWLALRGLRVTVNDLLILARVLHAGVYQPGAELRDQIATLPPGLQAVVLESLSEAADLNPALLIPMDASMVAPYERIFPATFRNALEDLRPVVIDAIETHIRQRMMRSPDTWRSFEHARTRLFVYLAAFAEHLKAIRTVAMKGQSFNTGTIKMLAHLPQALQTLLDELPQRVGSLNEVIKGSEVFSNVGRVAEGASISRFMSAKDDGRSKRLVWGIVTDNAGRMVVNLRDFRPHVAPLVEAGHRDLARLLTRHYLETYIDTLNQLGHDIRELTRAENAPPRP